MQGECALTDCHVVGRLRRGLCEKHYMAWWSAGPRHSKWAKLSISSYNIHTHSEGRNTEMATTKRPERLGFGGTEQLCQCGHAGYAHSLNGSPCYGGVKNAATTKPLYLEYYDRIVKVCSCEGFKAQ